jgi:hypothetical protein
MQGNKLDFNYNTSKNYEKLFELVQTQRIACIVTYDSKISDTKSIELRDICTSGVFTDKDRVDIGCRGTGYITAFPFDGNTTKEEFIKQCKYYKLEYIEPISSVN